MAAARIDDYALIGDTQTAALVSRSGSIDWACFPRFDSGACFAALLGERDNGRWSINPVDRPIRTTRRYRADTLVLETDIEVASGAIRLIDFMPIRGDTPDIVRIVQAIRGQVAMEAELIIRFDYGRAVPWVRRQNGTFTATAGPDALCLRSEVDFHGENLASVARFDMKTGDRRTFVLTWYPSHRDLPESVDPMRALADTSEWWRSWSRRCTFRGPWRDAVATSLRVLKALTYGPTGGVVAAPTTSLPEWPGGVRNWDYRYCWLRDATLTLYALMLGGYTEEAAAWREWLLRAVAGAPTDLQIMYGLGGERRLPEYEVPWLVGHEQSRPVRIGNAAHQQLQLDVYGEVMDALHEARRFGIAPDRWAWAVQREILASLESKWREADEGIWEVRGPRRHFTHSKVMAWVAFDRAIKSAESFGMNGPLDRWKAVRATIHDDVCARGYDRDRNSFVQAYDRRELDASLLMIPLVGFLPATDGRVIGTVEAIEHDLVESGFVLRYRTEGADAHDGLPPGEGVFLPCSFWLADVYEQQGRRDDAMHLFERLLNVRNDVGLLSEEFDPRSQRLLGNFPQAFSHLALVNTAYNLTAAPDRAARHRSQDDGC
jgi:GH15 family glucan-1,4-alpha-glucosidase